MKILVRGSEKEVTTTKGQFWKLIVFLMFKGHHVMKCYKKQTDSATVRGPPGPTIIIYKQLIRIQQQTTKNKTTRESINHTKQQQQQHEARGAGKQNEPRNGHVW